MLNQDLHIHTTFSEWDSAVVPEQSLDIIAAAKHARIVGISDHFECFMPAKFEEYEKEVKARGFHVGTEVNGHKYVNEAVHFNFEYYIYHCWGNVKADYKAIDRLLDTNKPVIIAHPYALDTDLNKISEMCCVEINNRYIWRYNWKKELHKYKDKFNWIFSSDAHQPHWLNQTIAVSVAEEVGINETILFKS